VQPGRQEEKDVGMSDYNSLVVNSQNVHSRSNILGLGTIPLKKKGS